MLGGMILQGKRNPARISEDLHDVGRDVGADGEQRCVGCRLGAVDHDFGTGHSSECLVQIGVRREVPASRRGGGRGSREAPEP